MTARMIDENATHQPRSDRKEVCAILPMHVSLIDKPQVCLVNQSRSLHRVPLLIAPFTLHVLVGQPVQFFINQRRQTVERCLVPIAPIQE